MSATPLVSERVRQMASREPQGRAWLRGLPTLIEELTRDWRLLLGPAFEHDGYTAVVLPARGADGEDAVLKLAFPHLEGRDEAAGLAFWDGDPTARLLRVDCERNAMLIERCRPGHDLRALPKEHRETVLAELIRRLWRRPPEGHRFRPLASMISYWAQESLADAERWPDEPLVREGLAVWDELSRPTADDVMLGTDVHAGNVLAGERRPWLVIDPKPFVGDPAYDATQHLFDTQAEVEADPAAAIRRFAELLDLDEARVRAWAFARFAAERRDDAGEWARANALARRLAPG